MIWKPGQLIQGEKYVIEAILGVGGFGVTYRAREQLIDRVVAIKTTNDLVQSKQNFAKYQEKFIQEAFRLARCNHNHIVRIEDICQEQGVWCMIMEYLTNSDLEQYVVKNGPLSESKAIHYISQIGSALDYLHQQSILHRDVKPSNIMLRQNINDAVLIDFGLAREFISGKIMTHTNGRSEGFAPIEQYQRRAKRGACTDVYALAATCYYLLTGVEPLPSQFRWQGVDMIPPQRHNPQIGDRLNRAILQGMAVQPEKRPQSIPEWLELLTPSYQFDSSFELVTSQDYRRLQALLREQKWRKADEETYEIILKKVNRVKEGYLDYKATDRLPCNLLKDLDRLWTKYSQGKFGFSVQRKIWQELGEKIDYRIECLLAERLGWRIERHWLGYDQLTFSLSAPRGHFPWNGHLSQSELKKLGLTGIHTRWWCCLISSRCAECQI